MDIIYNCCKDIMGELFSVSIFNPSFDLFQETLMLQNMTESDANVIISGISTRASDVAEVVKESTWYLQQVDFVH